MFPAQASNPSTLGISALASTPTAVTPFKWAGKLLFALCIAALAVSPASAQDEPSQAQQVQNPDLQNRELQEQQVQPPQTDGYGFGVLADTLDRTTPQPMPAFTDTPRQPRDEAAEEAKPATVHAEGASDDFDNSTPTSWWVYTGQTAAQVSTLLTNNNARLIDLQIDSVSPFKLSVTMVSNTGAYAKGWWWYYGLTATQVSTYLTNNKARLIAYKAYDIGSGQIRFAVVMIANSGADAKGWYYYYGQSISNISSLLTTNKARLLRVDPYVTGGNTYYTAVMISASGADNVASWWYIDASSTTLANAISAHNARIFYLTPGSSGTFNAIMESCASGCSEWWYYYGASASGLVNTALQNGARLVDFVGYPGCGGTCYLGAMINNSNAITTRVGNLIRNGGIGGTQGLFLKQVNGSVLANLEDGVVYEPASSIKVVANLYSMMELQAGNVTLAKQITHYTNGADSCPNPPVVSGTETLGLAIREMMYHSDNARTREITDHWGDLNINAYAHSIGMNNTSINHYIGCGGPTPDTFTLDDASKLYEGVANQTLLTSRNRGVFYSNMAGRAQFESEGYDWTGIWSTDIPNIINAVAPAGTTAAQKSAYQAAMNVAYKAGNYLFCQNNACTDVTEDIAITGWFQLPVCSASGTTYNEYTWGIFFSNVPNSGYYTNKVTPADSDFTTAKSELLREQIQAGMASCVGRSLDVMTYSPADLLFPATKVGTDSSTMNITVTNNQLTAVTGISKSIFGDFTATDNCGTSLAAGKSCTITAKFHPLATGERTGAYIISDAGTGQPQTIQLTGTGN